MDRALPLKYGIAEDGDDQPIQCKERKENRLRNCFKSQIKRNHL
jgi:hypothetical protein